MESMTVHDHFHARVIVEVDCYTPESLAEVSEVLSRAGTGLAIAHGVEPETSILWPHSHMEHHDEDEPVGP